MNILDITHILQMHNAHTYEITFNTWHKEVHLQFQHRVTAQTASVLTSLGQAFLINMIS